MYLYNVWQLAIKYAGISLRPIFHSKHEALIEVGAIIVGPTVGVISILWNASFKTILEITFAPQISCSVFSRTRCISLNIALLACLDVISVTFHFIPNLSTTSSLWWLDLFLTFRRPFFFFFFSHWASPPPPPPHFYCFPSSCSSSFLSFSLLLLLLISIAFLRKAKEAKIRPKRPNWNVLAYIDPTSTLHRPHIDPKSTWFWPLWPFLKEEEGKRIEMRRKRRRREKQ